MGEGGLSLKYLNLHFFLHNMSTWEDMANPTSGQGRLFHFPPITRNGTKSTESFNADRIKC